MTEVTFVGHSTVLIELGGTRLLTDPVLRPRVAHLRRIVAVPSLPRLVSPDVVLISHAHLDHLHIPSLRLLPPSCRVLVPRGWARLIGRAGLRDVTEVGAGDRVAVGGVEVLAVPAEHDGRRMPLGRAAEALGYVIEAGPQRVYFAGDTELFDGMRDLAGGIDLALLPVWGWGRRLPPGHLDPERAARAVALLEPRIAVPIHWGTLTPVLSRPSSDPAAPARAFAQAVARLAPGVEVRVLAPGGRTALPLRP